MRVVRRVTGVAMILFILAGCANGVSTSTSLSVSTSASASGTHSPEVTPGLSSCLSTQLAVVSGQSGVAMGHVGITGTGFKNISTVTCTLKGYPNLQMLDATGHPIPTHVIKGISYTVQAIPEKIVTLAPGEKALFDLGYDNSTGYGTASCPTSAQVKITPPNSNQPITVTWQLQPYGGGSIPKLRCGEITVSPVYVAPGN